MKKRFDSEPVYDEKLYCEKYIVKKNKMNNFIDKDLEVFSDQSDEEVFDKEFPMKKKIELNFMISNYIVTEPFKIWVCRN